MEDCSLRCGGELQKSKQEVRGEGEESREETKLPLLSLRFAHHHIHHCIIIAT